MQTFTTVCLLAGAQFCLQSTFRRNELFFSLCERAISCRKINNAVLFPFAFFWATRKGGFILPLTWGRLKILLKHFSRSTGPAPPPFVGGNCCCRILSPTQQFAGQHLRERDGRKSSEKHEMNYHINLRTIVYPCPPLGVALPPPRPSLFLIITTTL